MRRPVSAWSSPLWVRSSRSSLPSGLHWQARGTYEVPGGCLEGCPKKLFEFSTWWLLRSSCRFCSWANCLIWPRSGPDIPSHWLKSPTDLSSLQPPISASRVAMLRLEDFSIWSSSRLERAPFAINSGKVESRTWAKNTLLGLCESPGWCCPGEELWF